MRRSATADDGAKKFADSWQLSLSEKSRERRTSRNRRFPAYVLFRPRRILALNDGGGSDIRRHLTRKPLKAMRAESIRPSISETSYRFFDRPLHPELFSPAVVGRVRTPSYEMTVGICEGGHFLQMSSGGRTIVEVTAPDSQVLSTYGLQQTYFFNDEDELIVESDHPFGYHFAGQVDPVDFGVFTRVQMELEMEASRAFLSFQYPPHHRLLPGPLSLVQVEGNQRTLTVHTFHTFPEDLVVLRTQSLFEFV